MSTQANIHFIDDRGQLVRVLRTHDGYPQGQGGVLFAFARFFDSIREFTPAHRPDMTDSWSVARLFLAWHDENVAHSKGWVTRHAAMVVTQDYEDAEYIYKVYCNNPTVRGVPTVVCKCLCHQDNHIAGYLTR